VLIGAKNFGCLSLEMNTIGEVWTTKKKGGGGKKKEDGRRNSV
jgi:hypothetical protein